MYVSKLLLGNVAAGRTVLILLLGSRVAIPLMILNVDLVAAVAFVPMLSFTLAPLCRVTVSELTDRHVIVIRDLGCRRLVGKPFSARAGPILNVSCIFAIGSYRLNVSELADVCMSELLLGNVAAKRTVLIVLFGCGIVIPRVIRKLSVLLAAHRALSLIFAGCRTAGVFGIAFFNDFTANRTGDSRSTIPIVCTGGMAESFAFGLAAQTTGFR